MNRFEETPTPGIYLAIALTTLGVLAADLYTPLGLAAWIGYLVPVALTLFAWRPLAAPAVATVASALMLVTLMTDEAGIDPVVARTNRLFGALTIWVMAGVGWQFIRNKIEVRQQTWLQAGHNGLNRALSGDRSVEALGESLLRYLAEYMGAHAGAVFVADAQQQLHRVAGYALPADDRLPTRVQPGEGLIGQAFRDRRAYQLHDAPHAYLAVGSALGQAPPRHLLVAPLVADDAALGVVELGFMHPLYETDARLLERISESAAVALRSAEYRARLQELLQETQQQAEELQTQSEELRVTNEELEEQSRALQESQARLELQQTELEQTNTQLEEQTQQLEMQRDELEQFGERLQEKAAELEQASRYKSEFLANMSHELRTPLNASLILAKLLADNREGNLTAEQVQYARSISGAGQDLLALINDILDLSKIEAGRMEVLVEDVRLAALAERLRGVFEPAAAQKGLTLRVRILPGAPEAMRTDGRRLEQILKNLLSNAIKFTESGEAALEIGPAPGDRLAFAVRDTGIGISEAHQAFVF